ncbi:PIN domain-containing protein [Collinsella sp. TM10-22]|nr:PIN domain-containing protein [Collinsella sp. TM10-22]
MGGGGSALRGPGHRYVARIRRSRLGHNLFGSHGRALSPKGDDPVSGAPLKIMVDANVWVDSFCVDHAESLAARAFIGRATETGALLFFPVHIAKDVLYVVQHELKRSVLASGGALDEASARAIGDAALAFVRNMTENATAVGADASDLWLADKYLTLHRDYEDNLVLAACKRAQVDYLVTNDRKLLEHADLAAKTPRQMMPILALAKRDGAAIG